MTDSYLNRRRVFASLGAAFALPLPAYASLDPLDRAVMVVSDAAFIAIGERHDNPWHHKRQAELVAALSPRGLAFEMIPQDQENTVNTLRAKGASLDKIAQAINWEESGWPDWDHYAPILKAAPDAYIAGGGLSKSQTGAVYSRGAAGLGPEMAARYGLHDALPQDIEADMLNTQYEAHCGLVERSKLGAMVAVQRAWDAAYAEAWRRAGLKGGGRSILICGNAHARLDQGAPAYLQVALPEASIASIGQIETGDTDNGGEAFTAILSSPRPDREDPCDAMRRAMQRHKKT